MKGKDEGERDDGTKIDLAARTESKHACFRLKLYEDGDDDDHDAR